MLDYISDGYTEAAFLKGEDRIHGPFRFEFRPMLVEERALLYSDAVERLPDDAKLKKRAQAVAARIKSWSLEDGNRRPVAPDVGNLLRLKATLFWRVLNVVMGIDVGDLDPEAEDAETLAAIDARIEAAVAGKTTVELREVADAKN
jgi:hypothetical protein